MPDGKRKQDPYSTFRFQVEFDNQIVGGFSEVSGLQMETEIEEHREGGVNDFVHKLPKGSKYPNLVLKRGIVDSDNLWKWHEQVINGKVERKTVRVILLDSENNEKWHWTFEKAYPVKWAGPDFKADSSAIAVETLELSHHGMKKT